MRPGVLGSASFKGQLSRTKSGREIAIAGWGGSSVGEIDAWPRSLMTLVSAMQACPMPMFMAWGPDLLSFFNDAYRPILGQRVQGAIGKPFRELWHDILEDVDPLVNKALQGGSVEMTDMRLDIRRGGVPDESWWTFSYSPVHDDNDAIAGFLCVTRETTEWVKAEQASRKGAEQLQAALSVGDDIGSWEWDVVNDRVTTDERFALIYNVDPRLAAEGTPLSEFLGCIHPEDLPLVQSQIDNTLRYGDRYFAEYRIQNSVGEIHWISAQGRAIMDDNGKCIRFPGICFDITINKAIASARTARSPASAVDH